MKMKLTPNHSQRLVATIVCCLALAPVLAFAADQIDWRDKMQPIIPKSYLCRHTDTPMVIDGKLDDPAWVNAPWTSDFVDLPEDNWFWSPQGVVDMHRPEMWGIRQDQLLKLDEPMPVETETFIAAAAEKFGDAGRRAAYFLVDNMPAGDRAFLSRDFLMENLSLALAARTNFPWAKSLPERVFFNDVLPYAALDEPRDPWRADFFTLASNIVRDCTNATEAAQVLNRKFFKQIKVHYNLTRKRNNQSPAASIAQGKATCTGLSIILVDACRAVGVPARIAGVPQWVQKEGNHTWVEIWDGDWFFTGADEYDPQGLNRGWFQHDAALTVRSTNLWNQIYATSWRRTGDHFPLMWDSNSLAIHGLNVSARYAALDTNADPRAVVVHVRLREKKAGERLPAEVEMRSASGELLGRDQTRAGTADMENMPEFHLPDAAASMTFRFMRDGEARELAVPFPLHTNPPTVDFVWSELTPVPPPVLAAESWLALPPAERGPAPDLAFSRPEAERLVSLAWNGVQKNRTGTADEELSAKNMGGDDSAYNCNVVVRQFKNAKTRTPSPPHCCRSHGDVLHELPEP